MRGLVAVLAALSCAAPAGRAAAPAGALSSNAIKGPPPGGAAEASAAPAAPFDGSNKPPPAATRQVGAGMHRGGGGGMTQRGWGGGVAAPLTPSASSPQPFPCAEDEDCGPEEFCGGGGPRGGCPALPRLPETPQALPARRHVLPRHDLQQR